ncbi:MAG: DUF2231 domain-containing protein [bacterium]|nr:MAG: DUF2231 domain-containing protein [bacterium]
MPIHPFMVHFVIALFVMSVLLDILGWISRNEKLHFAAWINLIGASIGTLLAISSGLWDKNHILLTTESGKIMEIHESLAFISACLINLLALWRSGKRGLILKRFRLIYLIISLVGLGTVLSGAFYGGKLVFHYKTGIRSIPNSKESERLKSKPIDNSFYPSSDDTLR